MNTASKSLISFSVAAVCCLSSMPASAEGGNISGAMALSYAKQEVLPVSEAPGYMVLLGEVRGSNKNTGSTDYMDGAEVTNREIARLFQGNGQHSGYITVGKDGNAAVALWSGLVTTVMSPDGQPNTSFKGTWEYVSGTGKYSSIQGHGDYQGYFTSKTDYVVNWNGQYNLGK